MKELNGEKGFNPLNCSLFRFRELSINPQTKHFEQNFVDEAKGALKLEADGVVKNVRRPDNPEIDLDFECYHIRGDQNIFLDRKVMKNFALLRDKKTGLPIDTSNYPRPATEAYKNGARAVNQQKRWAEAANGTPIYEFLDCIEFRGSKEIGIIFAAFLEGVEKHGGDIGTVLFANYE